MYTSTYIYVNTCICVYIYVHIRIDIRIHLYVYIYIYIYIYTYIHTCMYICIYIYKERRPHGGEGMPVASHTVRILSWYSLSSTSANARVLAVNQEWAVCLFTILVTSISGNCDSDTKTLEWSARFCIRIHVQMHTYEYMYA